MSTNTSQTPDPEPSDTVPDSAASVSRVPIRPVRRRPDDPEALRKIARVVIAMATRGVTTPTTSMPSLDGDTATTGKINRNDGNSTDGEVTP